GIRPWQPGLTGLTLHVGAPGDAAAGRPVPTLSDAAVLLRRVRAKLQPAQVILNFPVEASQDFPAEDGQRWADTLQRRVLVPVAELAADGRAVLRDESGAEVPAMIRGLAYAPARPGTAPRPPQVLYRAVRSWLDLETEPADPGIHKLPGRAGGSDHYIQMTKSGPLLSKGRADAAALADADAAQPPAGRWYLHLHPTADQAVADAVKAAIRRDTLYQRMTERPMEPAATAPAAAGSASILHPPLRAPFDGLGAGAGYGRPTEPQVRLRGGTGSPQRPPGGRAVAQPGGPSRQPEAAAQPAVPVREWYGDAADNGALAGVHEQGLAALLGTAVEVSRLPRGFRPRDRAQDWVSAVQDAVTAAGGTPLAGAADQVAAQVTEDTLIRALPQVLAGETVQLQLQAGRRQVTVPLSAGKPGTGGIGAAAETPAGAPAGVHWRDLTLFAGGQAVTAPLPLVARGPVTKPGTRNSDNSYTGPAFAGTVHRADLADGVADRLFGQVSGTGVSRAGFGAALAGIGGHLGQAAGSGWLAQADGRAFLVRARVWAGDLLAVAQTPEGPRYVYELGLKLGAAAGDLRTEPASSSSDSSVSSASDVAAGDPGAEPALSSSVSSLSSASGAAAGDPRAGGPADDAVAVVTVTPLEAWRMELPLPDDGEESAPPVPPPDADSPLSLGLFGAAQMVDAGGRAA
ncbi:MAG TPA: hypothetical protein VK586_02315, partial [Streptosporangiaceae bacterium]|nr:hypothetical protein [Streptosporangiaceae bacterium]